MNTSNIIKEINSIEGIVLKEANFGIGSENRLTIHILNKKDYLKWEYFIERMKEHKVNIKVKKRYPAVTFVFPSPNETFKEALCSFEEILQKKYYLIEKPAKDSVTIIAKVTNLCNLDCQYCYDKPFRDKLGHNGIIPFEKLDKVMDMASKYAKSVTFIWHGGEPTLVGVDYVRRFFDEVLPKYPYADYEISMQTNGTLLDEEWFRLAKEKKLDLGSSYNATQEDLRHTKEDNALGSEQHNIFSVLENIKAAKKHDITTGVIDVMTKENHKRLIDIYEFYKREGVDACFNEIHNAGEAEKHDFLFLTKKDIQSYDEVATEYFTHWVNDKDEEAFVDRYASEYIRLLLTGDSTVCHNSGRCLKRWMGINSNGDIYPCDRALGEKYRMGNIDEINSFNELYSSPQYIRYNSERLDKITATCSLCNIYAYCKGNCPMQDIDEHNSAAIANKYSCQMMKMNLLCAYKALLNTDINKCNPYMRNFLIKKCLFLPQEIPALIERLGLTEEFGPLDFSMNTAMLTSREFEVFTIFNPPDIELQLVDKYIDISQTDIHYQDDDRLERAITYMKKRAKDFTESLK